ncbi:MAG TPA: DUF485 domain-containing protein [Stellaceae bacterium]|nr:DUF485 domain-containing protein [Stellaceae bacterium]
MSIGRLMPHDFASANPQDTKGAPTIDWSAAIAQPAFRELLRLKWRVIAPIMTMYLLFFSGLMLLAGYARPVMAAAALGPLSVGYVLIIIAYPMCWAVAFIYVFAADAWFDPKARAIARSLAKGGR